MAPPALFAAVGPDPLRAALGALFAAATACGSAHRELFAAVREAFPGPRRG